MYFILLFLLFGPFNNAYPRSSESNAEIEPQRIIGGDDAPFGSAPHMAALVHGETVRRVFCGGSIISTHHILTAAHCIDAVLASGLLMPSFRAIIGSKRWNSTRHEVKFSDYINHPKWDSEIMKYDVGVLIVTEEIKLNEKIAIIKLNLNWIGGGEESYVTGWGAMGPRIENNIVEFAPTPNKLQLLRVRTMVAQECIDDMAVFAALDWRPPVNPDVEICTFHSLNHGMCHGDSGSALVSEKTGRQIGVVSWGYECAVGAPDIFARISGVKDFLMPLLKGYV